MKYFLWQNEKHTGPFEVHALKRLVETRIVPTDTLCAAEVTSNEWKPISGYRSQPWGAEVGRIN